MVDIFRHTAHIDRFLEFNAKLSSCYSLVLVIAKGDFIDFLLDEVAEDVDCLSILAIDSELAAAGVLMQGNHRAPVRLSHGAIAFLDDVDARGLDGVWVPEVRCINDELRRNPLEQIVASVVLVNVTSRISGLLEEEMGVRWRLFRPVNASLADKLSPTRSRRLTNFKSL